MNAKNIREHMDVIGACGIRLGRVDRVEGNSIKLTKDSGNDGQHHYIPTDWVAGRSIRSPEQKLRGGETRVEHGPGGCRRRLIVGTEKRRAGQVQSGPLRFSLWVCSSEPVQWLAIDQILRENAR